MGIIINGQNDTIGPVDNTMSLLGTVSIGGTMTIEDFTNIDSVGIITARNGLQVTGGNVGINEASPDSKFHVNSGTETVPARFESTGTQSRIGFKASGTPTTYHVACGAEANNFIVYTNNTEKLRITSGGNLGIKNTSPNNTLTVGDTVQPSYTPSSAGNYIEIARTSGADAGLLINKNTGQWLVGIDNSDGANAPLRFEYGAAGSAHPGFGAGTLGMMIKHDGQVGVNKTPSTYQFEVSGGSANTVASFESSDAISRILFKDNSGEAMVGAVGDELTFYTSTNATERFRIRSDGRVTIGTQTINTNSMLSIHRGSSDESQIRFTNTTTGEGGNNGLLVGIDSNEHGRIFNQENTPLRFGTNNTERLRIESNGIVKVGSNTLITPSTDANNFVIDTGDVDSGLSILSATTGRIYFGDAASTDQGSIRYVHTDDSMRFETNSGERLRITSAGRIGINEATPDAQLHVRGSGNSSGLTFLSEDSSGNNTFWIQDGGKVGVHYFPFAINRDSGDTIPSSTYFYVHSASPFAIKNDGKMLIGSDTARTNFNNGTASPHIQIENVGNGNKSSIALIHNENATGDSSALYFAKTRGGTVGDDSALNQAGDRLGRIAFLGNDGSEFVQAATIEGLTDATPGNNDMPGRLSFSVTHDGASSPVERMRINRKGFIKMGPRITDGSHGAADLDSARHEFTSDDNGWTMYVQHTSGAASENEGILIRYRNTSPNGTGNSFIQGQDSNTTRFRFASNGGLYNYSSNNSNLSDEREKKNIVSIDTKWDKVKSWDIKKFHYNEDADTDDFRYGVIAQQVEGDCPEVLAEWVKQQAKDAVLDGDGNVVTPAVPEIIRKGVKEQQMMWMAVKALQEAQTRIETLETQLTDALARITALEG